MTVFKRLRFALRKIFKSKSRGDEWQELINFLGLQDVDESELSEATYFACLKVLGETLGKLPLKLMSVDEHNGVVTRRDHPLYSIVHDRPNPFMTSTTFWCTVEYNRNHYGNAYVWIKDYGDNTTLWILPSKDVEVWYDDACLLTDAPDIYYIYTVSGNRYCFGSEEILHFKTSTTFDGVKGISVREQLKFVVNGGVKSQKLINKLYDNGFTGKAVLQYTGNLNDKLEKSFTKGIQRYIDGDFEEEGIKSVVPIPYGSTLQPLNLKLSDNQFLEVKQYSALQIASAFGIKPSQIGDYTKSSYASAEAQQLSFYIDTILYIVKQYEEELTYKLLNRDELKNGLHFKFNIDVILRADFSTKVSTLSTAVNSFLMTPNEARGKLDLGNIEGGDRLLGNGASIPVTMTGSQYTKPSDNEVNNQREEVT